MFPHVREGCETISTVGERSEITGKWFSQIHARLEGMKNPVPCAVLNIELLDLPRLPLLQKWRNERKILYTIPQTGHSFIVTPAGSFTDLYRGT